MLNVRCISRFLKKIIILFIAVTIFFSIIFSILSIRAGYGIGYIPNVYKALIKDIMFSSYGPKTVPRYKFFGLYTKMAFKSLIVPDAEVNEEHMLDFDIAFFNRVAFYSGYAEIFVKEIYYFPTSNPKPFIIDCGSNIGLVVLYFKMLYPQAEILAFEPSAKCFQILKRNISSNKLTSVTAYNKAVADKNGTISFWDPSQGRGDGRASILKQGQKDHMTTVETVLLSDYITKPVDLLKVDIEGSEYMVFQDLAATGKLKLIKEIVLEYHHHIPNNNVDRLGHFLSFLEDNNFGYQIRGCNVGIGYQFDAKEGQLINLHAFNKSLTSYGS